MADENVEIRVERIHKLDSDGSLKGFADISIAGIFLIKGMRIISGKDGLFVGMPSEQGKDGKWYPTVNPLNKAVKDKLESIVLTAYEE